MVCMGAGDFETKIRMRIQTCFQYKLSFVFLGNSDFAVFTNKGIGEVNWW